MDITNEDLIQYYKLNSLLTKKFIDDEKYGFDLDLQSFLLRCYNLNPSRYGFRVQNYFANIFNYSQIHKSLNLGDFKNKYGEYIEFKCSFLDENKDVVKIRGIRDWQEIQYYYIFIVNFNDFNNITYKTYKLNKFHMKELLQEGNITKKEVNGQLSYDMDMKITAQAFIDFERKYLLKDFCINKVVDEYIENLKNNEIMREANKQLEERVRELEKLLYNK
jgi:hypothetical protein